MAGAWQITVVLEPEAAVAEVYHQGELWVALVDRGDGSLRLQTFPRSAPGRASDTWELDHDEAFSRLREARARLHSELR